MLSVHRYGGHLFHGTRSQKHAENIPHFTWLVGPLGLWSLVYSVSLVYRSIYTSIHVPIYLSIYLSIYLATYMYIFIYLPIYLSIYLYARLFFYLIPSYLSFYLPNDTVSFLIYLLPICLSIYLATYPSTNLSIHPVPFSFQVAIHPSWLSLFHPAGDRDPA